MLLKFIVIRLGTYKAKRNLCSRLIFLKFPRNILWSLNIIHIPKLIIILLIFIIDFVLYQIMHF